MRSTTIRKLTATLLAASVGVGWVSAGNLDQMNYVGVPGNTVDTLFEPPNSAVFPDNPFFATPFTPLMFDGAPIPEGVVVQTTGDGPQDSATWLRGWIEPPQTGDYTFWVAGNDDVEFYFNETAGSTGVRNAGLNREAYTDGSTGATSWATRFPQRSRAISLVKGQQYYFEVVQKSGGVGGIASLGWWLPDFTLERPVPIRYVQRFAFAANCTPNGCDGNWVNEKVLTDPVVDRGPGGATFNDITIFANEGSYLDLSPWISANYPVAFQWYKDDVAEDGEITSGKVFEKVALDQNGASYYITADGTTSKKVTLAVAPDGSAPTVEFASTAGNNSGFSVIYSEDVDPTTATDPNNYELNNGLVITDIEMQFGLDEGNIVVVTTDPAPTAAGQTVTINNVLDLAATPNAIADDTVATIALTDGIMSFRAFGGINGGANIGGTAISQFAYNIQVGVDPADWVIGNTNRFPDNPDVDVTVSQMAIRYNGSDLNFANNYGAQLIGFVTPPETGNYNFIIAADDQAALLISNDADPANKFPIAIEPQWRPYRNYTASNGGRTGNNGYRTQVFGNSQNTALPANQSRGTVGNVILQAGNKYFVEALMKEGGGGDNLDVTWQLPSSGWFNKAVNDGVTNGQDPIEGRYLSLFVPAGQAGPVEILTQPMSVSILENRPAGLNVVHKGSPSFEYQWYQDGGIIPDSNERELLFPRPQNADNGSSFTVVIRNLFSQEESVPAILTVIPDTEGPGIIRAVGSAGYNSVTITFDEIIDDASAANPANYSIDNGLTILDAQGTLGTVVNGGNTSVTFTTSPQTASTVYTVTINNVKDIAESENVVATDTTVSFTGWERFKGIVLGQIYRDIGGTPTANLYNSPKYPDSPDEEVVLTRLGFPDHLPYGGNNYGDNFGIRISGELTVPESGDWRFFTRSDDAGDFFLNTSGPEPPAETNPIARETGCCGPFREPNAEETSAPQTLVAGQSYGFTYVVKEGGGGDWGGVAMRREGDTTPANQLEAIFVDCCAVANPDETFFVMDPEIEGGTFSEGTAVSFTAQGSGTNLSSANPPVYWSWEVKRTNDTEFAEIPGANSATFVTPRLLPADNGSEWRAVATIPGLVTYGQPATLLVTPDTTRPTVTSVSGSSALNQVIVTFDEPVDSATGTSQNNYVIADSQQQQVAVNSASLSSDGLVVTLTTPLQTQGEVYDVLITGVKDTSFNANEMLAHNATFTAWVNTPGYVMQREYWNINGGSVANLTSAAKFPDSPDRLHFINAIDTPPSNDANNGFNGGQNRENFGTYMTGWLSVEETADYHFAISGDDQQVFYLSTDESPANLRAIVSEPSWNGWRNWNTNDRRVGNGNDQWFSDVTTLPVNRSQNTVGATTLTAGELYYFEAIAKEGGGGDSCAVTWWKDGDPMPANNEPAVPASAVSNFLNPDNRIIITEQPQSVEADLGSAVSVSVAATPSGGALGGPITYQWYKDGAMIPGATGTAVSSDDLQESELGDYWVVMNAPGAPETTSDTATVSQSTGPGEGPTLSIVDNGDGTVTVGYPTASQAAGNQLQGTLSLTPIDFQDDTSGADVAGSWQTTKDTTAGDNETYWRTENP